MTNAANDMNAYQAGAEDKRSRIRRIMALPEAQGREGVALQLALSDGVLFDAIAGILKTFPAGPSPTFNTRPIRIPRHLRLATCHDLEGAFNAIFR